METGQGGDALVSAAGPWMRPQGAGGDGMCAKLLQLCSRDPVDCSPPGSSGHGILQASILEWVAMPFPLGSSQPRDRTQVSVPALVGSGERDG